MRSEEAGEFTRILSAAHAAPDVASKLLPLVYNQLRKLAAQRLAYERPGQTLQATALVHEAYLRLVDADAEHWNGRGHFFAAAAEAMRRILIENARRRASLKHGAAHQHEVLDESSVATPERSDDLLDLDAALDRLAEQDPKSAELVKLRFFVGLTIPEAAQTLSISPRQADFLWSFARAWLRRELSND